MGNPNSQLSAPFLTCCRDLGSVFLFTVPSIHSPSKASRGAWKWSWLYSMYLPKDREVESALWLVWVNPIFRSSLSTFWSSLGGLSMLRFRSLYLHFPLSPIPALFHHVSLQFLGFSNPVALFSPLLNEEDAEGSVRPCPHPSLSFPSCGNNPSARISTEH